MRGMTSDEMLIGGPYLRDLGGSTAESELLPLTEKAAVARDHWSSSRASASSVMPASVGSRIYRLWS